MNIFEPYIESNADNAILHLKRSLKDRLWSVLAARILPILVIIIVFLSLNSEIIQVTGIVLAGIVFLGLTTIIIFNAGTGTEIFFREEVVEIYSLRLFGKRKTTVSLQDIAMIELEIFKEDSVSGAFYRFILKNGKRILVLKLPSIVKENEDKIIKINEKLTSLTHIEVVPLNFKTL